MTLGRPNIAEQVVLDYLTGKPDRTLDRQLDEPAIRTLAEQRGLARFDLSSVMKRMHAKLLLHPLAERLDLTPQAANNRLRLLLRSGAIQRERAKPERGHGGREFRYTVPASA